MTITDNSRADALTGGLAADEIEAKIAARVAAKQAKDYAEADRIRAELLDAGIALEDKPGGSTKWRRVFLVTPVEQPVAAPAGDWHFYDGCADEGLEIYGPITNGARQCIAKLPWCESARLAGYAIVALHNASMADAPLEGTGNGADERDVLNRLAVILESGQAYNGIAHDNAAIYAKALRDLLESGAPRTEVAGVVPQPIGPHDLCTSAGGRGYIAEFFAKRLRRHDFSRYITEQLAADFACALAKYLNERDAMFVRQIIARVGEGQ